MDTPTQPTGLLEVNGFDLWTFQQEWWIAITTNGDVNAAGNAVMGRGVAKEAANRFPALPRLLGDWLKKSGNLPYLYFPAKIITFPVKHHWHERASLRLIGQSAERILATMNAAEISTLYTVRPGCGNGHRTWEEVRPLLFEAWKGELDRFVIVEKKVVTA